MAQHCVLVSSSRVLCSSVLVQSEVGGLVIHQFNRSHQVYIHFHITNMSTCKWRNSEVYATTSNYLHIWKRPFDANPRIFLLICMYGFSFWRKKNQNSISGAVLSKKAECEEQTIEALLFFFMSSLLRRNWGRRQSCGGRLRQEGWMR